MVTLETCRQDVIDTTQGDRFNFDQEEVGHFKVVDDIESILAFTVRRSFDGESSAILEDVAERTAARTGDRVDILNPRRSVGYGVSVLDTKDAKYIFGVKKADAEVALDSVKQLLATLPQTLESNLGYGLVLGHPQDVKARRRYLALSLDLQSRHQIMLEREVICNMIGTSVVGSLSPHVSLLSASGNYTKAEKASQALESEASEIDEYINASDNPSELKLVLNRPEMREIKIV